MYNKYLKANDTKHVGQGVYTSIQIPANSPITEFTGDIYSGNALSELHLQVGKNTYMGASGTANDKFNHSCNPNCCLHIVGNRAILYSLYIIPANDELTFDYSTTSNDTLESWKMDCKCGSPSCRKVISGFQYLSKELQKEYVDKGIVPLFITEKMFGEK